MARSYLNPLSEIRNEIDRVFSDFSEDIRLPQMRQETSMRTFNMPPIEMSETDKDLIVSVALPGIDLKDINVEIMGNVLLLSGEYRREKEKETKQFHRSEFQYGNFMRRVTLPEYVNGDSAVAEYKNGILELRIPKEETAKRKRISVKPG